MNMLRLLAIAGCVTLTVAVSVQVEAAEAGKKVAKSERKSVKRRNAPLDATVAKDKLKHRQKRTKAFWWKERHEAKLAEIKASDGSYDLVLLGDSITHRWDRKGFGTNVLARLEKTYSVLGIGFGGDRTENVLWRITEGGELDGYKAKVVSLMIGTNNSLGYKPQNVADAIKRIIGVIREKQPQAKIVLTAILPRYGSDSTKIQRRMNSDAVNAIIKGYADGENVLWLDMNPKFPPVDGDGWKRVCPDGTHPIEPGYEIWAAELAPFLKKYCGR